MKFFKTLILISYFLALGWIGTHKFEAATLPEDEVIVLNRIARTMGAVNWNFDANACQETRITPVDSGYEPERNVTCHCENETCYVTHLLFKRQNLPGILPSELVNLSYLKEIDFAYNYLNGSIPYEWNSMQLEKISVFGNRLSGTIPNFLGNISTLKYLDLEVNNFSGQVPPELGQLANLETLRLSSNRLSGNLPSELADLRNLTDFRINDNNLNGSIPDFIQNWSKLKRLEIQGSGLEGPIPSSISTLENLNILMISDINGSNQSFPDLRSSTNIRRIVLKKCNINGQIPEYVWRMWNLRMLDLSFNSITGDLENAIPPGDLKFLFLTGNNLSGNIPQPILRTGITVDLSYNSFAWQSPGRPAWAKFFNAGMISNVKNVNSHSLYVNCGGNDVTINGKTYIGDRTFGTGVGATLYQNNDNWGFSSTGDFRDDNDELNSQSRFTRAVRSPNLPELYTTARLSALSLTYYQYCLENGNYSLTLHFAEIQFSNNASCGSLGRRLFDIYIQDKLMEKDFDIAAEAKAVLAPLRKPYNVSVTDGRLEIRFYWAGKGTQAIPDRGTHGPLISAISLENPDFKPDEKSNVVPIVVGIIGAFLVVLTSCFLWWRYYFNAKNRREKDPEGLDVQIMSFTLKQIKGRLADGTVIAVKQLSSKSSQGNREFMNEIGNRQMNLDWPTRHKICTGIAKGLAFLHEESRLKIVHRDIKGTNVLLDRDLNPKISDFGLAKLHEEEKTHISTRVAGTIGYIAPDGEPNMSYGPENKHTCLLDWACNLQQNGKLLELVDEKLGTEFNKVQAEGMVKIALLCTNGSPSLRPTMSEVVGMLEGTTDIPEMIPDPGIYNQDLRFKAIRDHQKSMNKNSKVSSSSSAGSMVELSSTRLKEISQESYSGFKASETQTSISAPSWTGSST
ncbi:hypothetical protein V6N11_005421 [Hibiscus sabdariffa]|uniref:non-specific serine/threonine protein kinase n=1 Tax=Hibiscus sabdariffa TaxID=183260 RepID=A0ABR2RN56_9ROSI